MLLRGGHPCLKKCTPNQSESADECVCMDTAPSTHTMKSVCTIAQTCRSNGVCASTCGNLPADKYACACFDRTNYVYCNEHFICI